ncbi:MAG: hypothetical protein R2824_22710 [Saprospiraceae bacterium]|nr:hypothetical protein [Lewinella sp.]
MKKVGLLFSLLLLVAFIYAQDSGNSNSNVSVTVDQNPNGGWTVTATATSETETNDDGTPLQEGSQTHSETEDLEETIESTTQDAQERLKKREDLKKKGKEGSSFKLGPDGQGDMRNGGTFPPEIVITIGDMPQGLKVGRQTIMLNYRSQSQFRSNLGRDLRGALAKL